MSHRKVSASERMNQSVNITSVDARTLILPKVPPCKYCGAFKFYRETKFMCCSKGTIVLAELVLPKYLVFAHYWN
ncbi:hypothetical protein LIER_14815 [Lithospermum erythrorhizon]|uniref:Uncharacterized protein n=1 Tax=Lithospermum erythrorhizon TaxID=34254 RepID=A0AAV3Q238_LITER